MRGEGGGAGFASTRGFRATRGVAGLVNREPGHSAGGGEVVLWLLCPSVEGLSKGGEDEGVSGPQSSQMMSLSADDGVFSMQLRLFFMCSLPDVIFQYRFYSCIPQVLPDWIFLAVSL